MKRYCEECKKEVETTIVAKKESYNVCGEMRDDRCKRAGACMC